MRVRRGTKAASSATAVNSPSAPSLSSPTRMNTTVWPAMRTSSPRGAPAVKRSARIQSNKKNIPIESGSDDPGSRMWLLLKK